MIVVHYNNSRTSRILTNLVLGEEYLIKWYPSSKVSLCKFIKVTEKGYNFLNLETDSCILKHHLYVPNEKWLRGKEKGEWFFLNSRMMVARLKKSKTA